MMTKDTPHLIMNKDLVEASRAIHDALDTKHTQFLDGYIKDLEARIERKFTQEIQKLREVNKELLEAIKSMQQPQVNVTVPPPRRMIKTHVYDEQNRPWQTIDEEVKD